MEDLNRDIEREEFKKFKHATLYWLKSHPHIALMEANASYIPIEQFKEAFHAMEELIIKKKINKLIFDKRQLSVFHQPSMEWYFVEWKEKMADYGLVNHIKILPQDEVFCQSVKIGREQINKKYPQARFRQLYIQNASSVEEAVKMVGI